LRIDHPLLGERLALDALLRATGELDVDELRAVGDPDPARRAVDHLAKREARGRPAAERTRDEEERRGRAVAPVRDFDAASRRHERPRRNVAREPAEHALLAAFGDPVDPAV